MNCGISWYPWDCLMRTTVPERGLQVLTGFKNICFKESVWQQVDHVHSAYCFVSAQMCTQTHTEGNKILPLYWNVHKQQYIQGYIQRDDMLLLQTGTELLLWLTCQSFADLKT